jgi:AcrR family transcriptional regulator
MTAKQREAADHKKEHMRRKPKQARSEQSVERIKLAMRQIILEQSYAAATTNEIARRAGVNISSLYFFFPNREAIAQSLFETASLKIAHITHKLVLQNLTQPLQDGVANMLTAIIEALDDEQLFLLQLTEQVPELRESADALAQERLGRQVAQLYLEHQLGQLDAATMARKLFFVQHLSFDLMRRYVVEKPPHITRQQFITELSTLIATYVKQTDIAVINAPEKKPRKTRGSAA